MVAGADSIKDMDLLRRGAMPGLFGGIRAASTLGSFLRSFTWGSVLQSQKVHREFLAELAARALLLPSADVQTERAATSFRTASPRPCTAAMTRGRSSGDGARSWEVRGALWGRRPGSRRVGVGEPPGPEGELGGFGGGGGELAAGVGGDPSRRPGRSGTRRGWR